MTERDLPTYVVVGGGAGGLELVTRLGESLGRSGRARIVLVDQFPIHIWKPHLHEVAAGSLDVGLHRLEYLAQARWHYFEFQLGPLLGIDRTAHTLRIGAVADSDGQPMLPERTLHYDRLVIAIGSQVNTFKIEGAIEHAVGLNSVYDAERFHQKLLAACMRAETRAANDQPVEVDIAIIGAGATGVELAAELRNSSKVMATYGLHRMDPKRDVRITVVEGATRILPGLSERISTSVGVLLGRMAIDVKAGERVTAVRADGVNTASGLFIPADLVVWAAGLKAPDLLSMLDGLETNHINQLVVDAQLRTTRSEDIYALGDCAHCAWMGHEGSVPPRAQSAHQQATYLSRLFRDELRGRSTRPFRYRDFGSLVSLGRSSAVGNLMGGLIGGNLFIDGLIARFMYKSLYQMHQLALHGMIKTTLDFIANQLRKATQPHIKLH
ncbi:MAG: NAD(P)/FAD-dependent oxidoreductase [Steroidobacterales bacterium]